MFSSPPYHTAIIGGGVAGFAAAGNLLNAIMDAGIHKVKPCKITLFQPPFVIKETNLPQGQRDRLTILKERGILPEEMIGCGMVFNPLEPSLFTFNGDSSATGFDFVKRMFEQDDYFKWLQQNRETIAALYPDFVEDNGLQRHPHHNIDNIDHTSPRGAYGLYLNEKFTQLKEFAAQNNIEIEVIHQAACEVTQDVCNEFVLKLEDNTLLQADSVICATGHAYHHPDDSKAHVFSSYPTQHYNDTLKNASHVAVMGAGPAGIETALHLIHNLDVKHVSMVSKSGHSRLPYTAADEDYIPLFLTRENFLQQPDAAHLEYLLQQELAHCYSKTQLPCPKWSDLIAIPDYMAFMESYQQEVKNMDSPHPLATLVRPVKSFPRKISDDIPEAEKAAVAHVFARMEHLFGSQSVPSAELMAEAWKDGTLSLHSGTLDKEGTISVKNGESLMPDGIVLATGFDTSPSPLYQQMLQDKLAIADYNASIGIKQNNATGGIVNPDGNDLPLFAVHGSSLFSVNSMAQKVTRSVMRDITHQLTQVEKLKLQNYQNRQSYGKAV